MDPTHYTQCLLLAHSGKCSVRQSSDFRTDLDCALQTCPVLQAYGVEPADDGESDDTLYKGDVRRVFLFNPKVLSFFKRYCCCWHLLRISSVLEANLNVMSKNVPMYLYSQALHSSCGLCCCSQLPLLAG